MQTPPFTTTNPDLLEYQNADIHISVMGGIKLEGLERMRATLKIEHHSEAIRHSLDLYNDTQLTKLIRKTAERFEIGTSIVGGVLNELITELENYRLEQLEMIASQEPQAKQLTEEERKEAETFLKSKNLLEATNHLIGQSGVIGEETNRLLMYLIFTSRKREQPLHVVSLGASGSGKTHLQEKVGDLIPEEDKIEITTLSENAFYYFGQRELQHKLILIEDLDGAESVLYPLRELQSKRRISKTVARKNTKGETRTINLTVEGPVSVAGCTTKEKIYEDNANRSFLLYLDDSAEQDKRIIEYQQKISAGKINRESEQQARELLKNCQRILQPIKVVNPYAELLTLPESVLKPRRTNNHYLQFIEAVTYYHQYQRQAQADQDTGEAYINTTIEDIKQANKLLKEVLLRKSDDLSGACRNHFEKLKLYLLGSQQESFTNQEISKKMRIPITTVKRHHYNLHAAGYLKATTQKGSKTKHYSVVTYEEYQQLKQQIETILDQALQKVEKNMSGKARPKSPPKPSSKSEPIKNKKNRELEEKPSKSKKKHTETQKNH